MVNLLANHLHFGNYVSNIEIIWTIIALAGGIFAAENLRESIRDRAALREAKVGNGRLLVAVMSIKNEALRLAAQVIHILIGFVAFSIKEDPVLTHSPPDQSLQVKVLLTIIPWGLVIVGVLLFWQSYNVHRLRIDLNAEG